MSNDIKDALHLQVKEEFNITGRGKAIVVDLELNGYRDLQNKDLRDLFMGKYIIYKGYLYSIVGIEIMGALDRYCKETGFLLRQAGVWHQLSQSIKPDGHERG